MIEESARKELIEYYKWVVSVIGLILAFSVSVVKIGTKPPNFLMIAGWVLYFVSVFFNWLLIKRLITLPIVENLSPERREWKHRLFELTVGNMSVYATVQNTAILFGSVLLLIGFLEF